MTMQANSLEHPGAHDSGVCSNMIAVASGKGGVGKTWFSISLSHALARAGRKTLLFDGDLGLANVDVQLGLAPGKDISEVLAGRYAIGEAKLHYEDGGFDVIAGRSGSGALSQLSPRHLASLSEALHELGKDYETLVLDLGAGVERTVRRLAAEAGTCLVIVTDEPTSLTDAYAFIKLCTLDRRGADIRVVVNMANSPREGERTYATLRKACESFLKTTPPLAGIIRSDAKVKDSIRHQVSILQRHPGSCAATDIESLVRNLLRDA